MLGPGDDQFLTQTIQIHFVELFPGGSNHGHGHQNEALFYILEGRGYEIHDGKRYDWEKDDLVVVHNDSVHRHFNADPTCRAVAIVMKAKSAWMYLGLWQQGRSGPVENAEQFGPREEWSRVWTPGGEQRKKVLKPADTRWETTRGCGCCLRRSGRTSGRAAWTSTSRRSRGGAGRPSTGTWPTRRST